MPTSRHERALRNEGYARVAGVDEAGRGALFGPVFAAAVVLDPARRIIGLDDSKQLEPERREVLAGRIRERALAWSVGVADAFEIDRVNILEASKLAMRRAVAALGACDALLIDAVRIDWPLPQLALIHGDALSFSIAAASILAKVARDRAIRAWDQVFPGYDLASNKGYGSPAHLRGLEELGPTELHRFSFLPVRERAQDPASRHPLWTGYPEGVEPDSASGGVKQPKRRRRSADPFQGELFACQ